MESREKDVENISARWDKAPGSAAHRARLCSGQNKALLRVSRWVCGAESPSFDDKRAQRTLYFHHTVLLALPQGPPLEMGAGFQPKGEC